MLCFCLIPHEDIPGVDLVFHIVQHAVVAVGDDGLALLFEGIQITHTLLPKKAEPSSRVGA